MRSAVIAFATTVTLLASAHASAIDRRPGPDQESTGAVSVLESSVETARLGSPGWIQGEFAYRAAFAAYENFGQELTLHTGELLIDYTISRRFQAGVGWHMFGVIPDEFSKISGVGDPYLRGKLSLPLQSANNPHAIGVVAEARFGVGQVPATQSGFTATILGIYTVQMGGFGDRRKRRRRHQLRRFTCHAGRASWRPRRIRFEPLAAGIRGVHGDPHHRFASKQPDSARGWRCRTADAAGQRAPRRRGWALRERSRRLLPARVGDSGRAGDRPSDELRAVMARS